ncbi:hypothetical protein C7212DRAFT_193628 [Tuber magnatum]|uniref:Uncharacterized protein n=1 Tax=Tuber magnatum TaxID=42249 RepID=A0A317SRC4_9PEZI|nr:hypothetical protein C7212DRAFT_193628 [Tuber magnatum]
MNTYTNPPRDTYVIGITKHFTMPTDSGGIPAVAVSSSNASLIVSAYTILILLIFVVGWKLVLASIVAFWPTRRNPNRYMILVALWNSSGSMNATIIMQEYCIRMIHKWGGKVGGGTTSGGTAGGAAASERDEEEITEVPDPIQPRQPPQPSMPNMEPVVSTLLWCIFFFFLALSMSVGSVVASVLTARQLLLGNAAPPAPEAIFYPDIAKYGRNGDNGAGLAMLNSLKAPSALRALGAIEASGITVRERVSLERGFQPGGAGDNPWMALEYHYNVTGVDIGLQTDSGLELRVKGSCHTDYMWLANSSDTGDTYRLFGGNDTYQVKRQPNVDLPPMVGFFLNPRSNGSQSSNTSFAMIVNTAGLYSYTPGQDPWYSTETTQTGAPVGYRVRKGRPVLSCWETRRWSLGKADVEASKLNILPGLKLHKLWIDLFSREFAMPRVVSLGRAAGSSALRSATFSAAPSYILDASASSILDDLERLVLASWVSSSSVLRDTTRYNYGETANYAGGGKGSVEASAAMFVLQTRDVGTLSIFRLIYIPALLLALLVIEQCLNCMLKYKGLGRSHKSRNYVTRGIALRATQLYRYLDEELYGRARWMHRLALIPAMYENYNAEGIELQPGRRDHYLPGSARHQGDERYRPGAGRTDTRGKTFGVNEEGVSYLHDCAEPRPILTNSSSPVAELTISRREDPENLFTGMERVAFNRT